MVAHLEEERQLAAYRLGLRAIPEHCWHQEEAADGLNWMICLTGEISPAFLGSGAGPDNITHFRRAVVWRQFNGTDEKPGKILNKNPGARLGGKVKRVALMWRSQHAGTVRTA